MVLLVAVATAGCGDRGASVSRPAAGIEIIDAEGLASLIERHRGRPLIVNFWARWCGPCVAELPELVTAGRTVRAAGGVLIGVALDPWAPGAAYEVAAAGEALPGFLKDHGVDYPIYLYGSSDALPLIERLGIPGDLPVTLGFDRRGERVALRAGALGGEELEELVDLVCDG